MSHSGYNEKNVSVPWILTVISQMVLWSLDFFFLNKRKTTGTTAQKFICDKSSQFYTKIHCGVCMVPKFFTWLAALIFTIGFIYHDSWVQNHHRDGLRLSIHDLIKGPESLAVSIRCNRNYTRLTETYLLGLRVDQGTFPETKAVCS